jgi:hypothetical protein
VPDGPIIRLPDVPWSRPESVFDSSLVKAMRMITEVLGPNPEEQVMGMVGTTDIPGPLQGVVPRAVQNLARRLGMYSRVEQVAQQVPAKGVHPNRLGSMLKSGASQEELAYRRVPELLASHGDKPVTAEALQSHLAANPAPWPKVVTKGGPSPINPDLQPIEANSVMTTLDAKRAFEQGHRVHWYRPSDGVRVEMHDPVSFGPNSEYAKDVFAGRGEWRTGGTPQVITGDELPYEAGLRQHETTPTKFAQYQLPGGESYREQLLTLPPENMQFEVYNASTGKVWKTVPTQAEASAAVRGSAPGLAWRVLSESPTFASSHWDEPNVLVHVRHNERTLPTGERGRFLEEVQSDWHQKGKVVGYKTNAPRVPTKAVQQDNGVWEVTDQEGRFFTNIQPYDVPADGATAADALEMAHRRNRPGNEHHVATDDRVPDAPFKDTWPDLALKQQLAELADDPKAEWLGFAGSKAQVDRYGTERLTWAPDGDGWKVRWEPQVGGQHGDLDLGEEAIRRGLIENASTRITSLDDLERLIGGSDVKAEKAWKRIQAQKDGGSYLPRKEGMETFYDELLPKRLEKLVKPFGGTVERLHVSTAAEDSAPGWIVRLTPEMKAKIKAAGLPLAAIPFAVSHDQEPQR